MKKNTLILALGCIALLGACSFSDTDEKQTQYLGVDVCPQGWVDTPNAGMGDPIICCPEGSVAEDGLCIEAELSSETQPIDWPEDADIIVPGVDAQNKQIYTVDEKEGYVLLSAPNSKGSAYCPSRSNSLAWDGSSFRCCGRGMKAVVIPSRSNSICCPDTSTSARWAGAKWNDYECCPQGTVEVRNQGEGGKYACCPEGQKAVNGKCYIIK